MYDPCAAWPRSRGAIVWKLYRTLLFKELSFKAFVQRAYIYKSKLITERESSWNRVETGKQSPEINERESVYDKDIVAVV